jgi:hypothetical protein
MPDPTSWDEAQTVAGQKLKANAKAWVAWGVADGAKAEAKLAAADKLLKAADLAAKAAEAAAKEAARLANPPGGAVVDAAAAAAAAAAAKEAETKKIEAWKNAAQAIALANEVKGG